MLLYAQSLIARRRVTPPWNDVSPVREEMFGAERLEQHAESLAAAQPVTADPPSVRSLRSRLDDNARALLLAYRASAEELESGRDVVPAAEWLLDNYHLVEDQIREIREDLPAGYYRQLPKLATGPFAGYPRVLGIAWAFVAHTDSHFDPATLARFVTAYQRVQPLTIGELWAAPITLRIVLIENLRRLADQIDAGRTARADAEALANRLRVAGGDRSALDADIATRSAGPVSELFAAQLAKRFRDQDPRTNPALEWLDARLTLQGSSIDEAVRHAQQRQGASNVTIRNIITSMRLISDIDWAELFESVSLVDARLREASDFAAMDFATRNLYRGAIEQLARGSSASELEVADAALEATRNAERSVRQDDFGRGRDPGFHLIAEGRPALERTIGFRPPPALRFYRFSVRLGIGGYVSAILVVACVLLAAVFSALASHGAGAGWLLVIAALAFAPATDVATALINRLISWSFGAHVLPGLDLSTGVPSSHRTLVAMPTMLTGEADLLEHIGRLEIHHLAGAGGDLTFALVSDGVDAEHETLEGDDTLLAAGAAAIARLNARYGPGPAGDRFLLLHRRRLFNAEEGVWMGWERKRGKLHELNRLLRGATDTTFAAETGLHARVPTDVRFVITLDADTRLPRDAAARLIGKMAHSLNRPTFDATGHRVVGGYGILQPRVTPSLPIGREGSIYQRAFSAPGGVDPYAAAVSDVYQDLFGEGSYTGKGIYDVDAFEAALLGRTPDNAMLSHDLFEGVFARAGLASDVEVIEDFPSRYDVAARRQHRWTRGDWQLLPWVFGIGQGRSGLPGVGRGKMLDNLRRSLAAPALLATLAACWLLPLPAAVLGVLAVVAAAAIPAALALIFAVVPARAGVHLGAHNRRLVADLKLASAQLGLQLAFLPDQAWRMGDAIIRTLVRVFRTRRLLLQWTTAAQSTATPRLDLPGFYGLMGGGTLLGVGLCLFCLLIAPASWPLILPFAVAWGAAPALALWVSRSPKPALGRALTADEATELRLIARRTWRFFETFVTPADSMLPPDNFQEDPKPVVARRTSPTNVGIYLLSAVAARDFGWAGVTETVERIEATFASLRTLQRHRGHFLNWYGTANGEPLIPAYVSTVDSGNLAGHLIALANACEEWAQAPSVRDAREGFTDDLALARQALAILVPNGDVRGAAIAAILDEIDAQLRGSVALVTLAPALARLADKALRLARDSLPPADSDGESDFTFWIGAFARSVASQARDRAGDSSALDARLSAIAAEARATALEMDFAFLLDPERKLLSIGYSLPDNRLDPSCYDLLASEARLASLFAIAKGDAPTRHWFRLGRTATPIGGGSALVSWSGSMFEYLMPSLVMRAPAGSLLDETNRLVVSRQQEYGRALSAPWGVSESAYNARDLEFTYQYSNFGVPGLGLKRGLADNAVIAPYATGLAAMVDPQGARANFARLAELGANGQYGFYEALDFTRSRLPDGASVAIVRNYMAHHQGMTIVALANVLHGGSMRARFHREPMIQACELLLQERMPRDVAVAQPRAEEVKATPDEIAKVSTVRHVTPSTAETPVTHVLSNGRYAVMLTAEGTGYSRWRDLAVTRWRADPTLDDLGSFVLLRDVGSGRVWSASAQPLGAAGPAQEVTFGEDHATFVRRDGALTTTMDILVSGEIDGEVRRVKLANTGRAAIEIELTSYSEVVLAPPASDTAHPAFSKLFVVTEHLAEFGALIATRRPRTKGEAAVCAAHFAVVEGESSADPEYETDRAKFLGRSLSPAEAFARRAASPLSNTVGTVLDPVFAIRRRVIVPPGGTARVSFWTVVAPSRAELLDLVDTHLDRSAFDRAKTLAWTQAQVQLRHLGVTADEAADFQRLAAPLLYPDARFRAPSDVIVRGSGAQSGLWPYSVSGDLPIVLLRIDDVEDMAQVRQLLRAHEYWRIKQIGVDLVIINEHASSYLQDLQIAIDIAVRSSQSRPRFGDAPAQGAVHALRADLLTLEGRNLILSVARVVLVARHGSISAQLARLPKPAVRAAPAARANSRPAAMASRSPDPADALEFFNELGGFGKDGREYVTILDRGRTTPAPWINVIANRSFGFQVSAGGSGGAWSENSRENQLTPWSNDPVADPAGEALYLRDEETGAFWTATAQPISDGGRYVARHGFGYSRFEHEANGVALELTQFVPVDDPIKISRLTLRNMTDRPRRLSVTAFAEWTLGSTRSNSAPFVVTAIDGDTGALFARNPWGSAFPGRVAFADLAGRQTGWTADRCEFLGRHGGPHAPAALLRSSPLGRAAGAGLDPCAALSTGVTLAPNESVEVVWLLGQSIGDDEARALVRRYREADLDAVLAAVTEGWEKRLGAVHVRTPDRAMDVMLNGWLLYQALGCRIWARTGFYQASGAYGFRDQMQDGMALSLTDPAETRSHLLRASSRQFPEGDVQHWWLPHSGQGVRTRISDDRVWLSFAVATYVASSGDAAVLDEETPFLDGPLLKPGEHDAFFQPMESADRASVFEHCARGLDQCVALTGPLGLPLMGTGDWNDGMNRVGEGGAGESVWLGWLFIRAVALFAPLAEARDPARAARWREHAETVRASIEREAWDGAWYRRATFDDGAWLGSTTSEECRIDSIAQTWAVLSGAAEPARAAQAMASVDAHLIRRNEAIAVLFTPPFVSTIHDPGYIKGYPAGLRENGGQYSHAAMWAILAFAKLGAGAKAHELFALLNPINHARDPAGAERYKVEPYVVAADVYSVAPHAGRGGWTWYTGSAAWMYRAGLEGILGVSRQGAALLVAPCIPDDWPGFEATITVDSTRCRIEVRRSSDDVGSTVLDGQTVTRTEDGVRIPLDRSDHDLTLILPVQRPLPEQNPSSIAHPARVAAIKDSSERIASSLHR